MSKLNLQCLEFRRLHKNSLRGVAKIRIAEMRMTVHEVAVHESNGKAWASPPARPWVKEGQLVRAENGRPRAPIRPSHFAAAD